MFEVQYFLYNIFLKTFRRANTIIISDIALFKAFLSYKKQYLAQHPTAHTTFAQVPLLTSLSLRNNPVTESRAYKETVLRKLKHLVELDGRPITGDSTDSSEVLLCVTPRMLREALAGQNYGQPGEHSFLGDEQVSPGETYRGSEDCSGGWSRESSAGGEKRGTLTGGSGGGERGQSAKGGAKWREGTAGVWDGVLGEVSDLVLEHRRLRGLQVSGRRAPGYC
jgi:hypothetical protein